MYVIVVSIVWKVFYDSEVTPEHVDTVSASSFQLTNIVSSSRLFWHLYAYVRLCLSYPLCYHYCKRSVSKYLVD